MLVPLNEVVTFDVVTHSVSTGGVSDADAAPTFDVYEETTDAGMLGAQTMTKRTSLTGNYRGTFTANAANGFEAGKWYSVIATGIVGGVTGKTVAMQFRCGVAETQAGMLVIDAGAINGVLTSSVTTINANVGTTQPTNFTGTGGSALVKGDAIDWNSVAVTGMPMPTYAQPTGFLAATFPGGTIANTTNITAGTITTTTNLTNLPSIPANWITAAGIQDGAIDRATFAADTGLQTIRSGTAQAGGVNTITLDAGASATDDAYKGLRLIITGGNGAGGSGVIFGYVGSTKVASVTPTWTLGTPNNTSTFAIVPAAVDVETWRTDQPNGLTNSFVPSFVSQITAGAITANAIASGAITAAKFATDAIDSNALAASAVAEIQSGLSTLTAAGLLDLADGVETGVTLRQAQRVQLAAAAGKTDGFVSGGAGTGHVRNTGDTKNRITATYDANGNRTVIVLDLT